MMIVKFIFKFGYFVFSILGQQIKLKIQLREGGKGL